MAFVNEYALIRTLGKGSFGTVKLGLNTKDFKLYALKLLPKSRAATSSGITDPEVVREISVMRQLEHPNIVRLHEVIGKLIDLSFIYCPYPFTLEILGRLQSSSFLI